MVKMSELNCPYDIHHICGMTLTCNGASHCICIGNIAFHGCECMIEIKTPHLVIAEWARYRWMKSNRVARFQDMEKKKKPLSGNSKKG